MMTAPLSTHRACWLLCLSLTAAPDARSALQDRDQAGYPFGRALDGQPAIGPDPAPSALARLMRGEARVDRKFVAGLMDSAGQVEALLALAAGRHDQRGYFALISDRPLACANRDVKVLQRRFEELLAGPIGGFQPGRALALARMAADERFWVRQTVAVDASLDLRHLRAALALFNLHAHGFGGLQQGAPLRKLAWNADLAAARLRALRLDLEALYEPVAGAARSADPAHVRELTRLLEGPPSLSARRVLDRTLGATRKLAERLSGELYTQRFDERHVAALAQRAAAQKRAARAYREMVLLVPLDFQAELPSDVAELKTSERYRRALNAGIEALALAPGHDGINYMLGICLGYRVGSGTSTHYLERFLALRGILHWDHRCFSGRWLDAQESYAAWVVARWLPTKGQ